MEIEFAAHFSGTKMASTSTAAETATETADGAAKTAEASGTTRNAILLLHQVL